MVIIKMGYLEQQRRLIAKLKAEEKLRKGLYHSRIEHEDTCLIWEGKNQEGNRCSCQATVTLIEHTTPLCRYCQDNFTSPLN